MIGLVAVDWQDYGPMTNDQVVELHNRFRIAANPDAEAKILWGKLNDIRSFERMEDSNWEEKWKITSKCGLLSGSWTLSHKRLIAGQAMIRIRCSSFFVTRVVRSLCGRRM